MLDGVLTRMVRQELVLMDLEKFRVNGEFLIDSTTRNLDFGVNGVYLPMDNGDDFEIDKSGKGNNYTKTN